MKNQDKMLRKKYLKELKRQNTTNEIIEYINDNYTEDLTVSMLADHFFMSESYFAHIFKKSTGKSVIEYVNELRISHACAFLELEESSISDIAVRVGFNDINYFSRKFKSIMGITPTEYKRIYLKSR